MGIVFYLCSQWQPWPELFGLADIHGAGPYVLSYVLYCTVAIVFALISAVGVKIFAPYACGSGIPEVGGVGMAAQGALASTEISYVNFAFAFFSCLASHKHTNLIEACFVFAIEYPLL